MGRNRERKFLDASKTAGPITGTRIKLRVDHYMKAVADVVAKG